MENINDEFINIKKYFDILNNDKSHFINSNDICTPMDCVKEMVDKIPNEFWNRKDIKILDSCCGNGNFHAYISTKTNLKNLYFNEINEKRIKNLKKYFSDNINITIKDFLSFEDKEEYDLVVSNPPYAKFDDNNNRLSKNHNLSRDFLKKALNITKPNGYILFILPNNWMSFSDRNVLPNLLSQYQFIYLDINGAKKWFPKVGSSFTWFLLHKVPNTKSFIVNNNYIINDQQIAIIDKNINYIPLYYSNIVRNIFNKTINNKSIPKYKIETSSFLHRFTKKANIRDIKSEDFCYKLIHTPKQTVWSNIPHKYQDGHKVFLSLTDQYQVFIDDCGMTQSIAYIKCNSIEETKKIEKELNIDFYKFINNLTRYGNFNNIRILQNFPIWGTFELTKEEKEFIKKINEIYYGKSKK
jgi:tRNA1(Val) A37 N6-methylase TrmN6